MGVPEAGGAAEGGDVGGTVDIEITAARGGRERGGGEAIDFTLGAVKTDHVAAGTERTTATLVTAAPVGAVPAVEADDALANELLAAPPQAHQQREATLVMTEQVALGGHTPLHETVEARGVTLVPGTAHDEDGAVGRRDESQTDTVGLHAVAFADRTGTSRQDQPVLSGSQNLATRVVEERGGEGATGDGTERLREETDQLESGRRRTVVRQDVTGGRRPRTGNEGERDTVAAEIKVVGAVEVSLRGREERGSRLLLLLALRRRLHAQAVRTAALPANGTVAITQTADDRRETMRRRTEVRHGEGRLEQGGRRGERNDQHVGRGGTQEMAEGMSPPIRAEGRHGRRLKRKLGEGFEKGGSSGSERQEMINGRRKGNGGNRGAGGNGDPGRLVRQVLRRLGGLSGLAMCSLDTTVRTGRGRRTVQE